ncbi:ABC transporter permease [soil metagenome]
MSDVRPPEAEGAVQAPIEPELHAMGPVAGSAEGTILARSQWQLFRRKFLRHKAAMASSVMLLLLILAAIFADTVAPYGFNDINVTSSNLAPTFADQHYFGTDQLGRDYFSRVVFGLRTSLVVGALVALVSSVIGSVIGALAGYYGGMIDAILMRFTDLVLIVPGLAVLLVAAGLLEARDPVQVALILAGLVWVSLARIVRGSFLSLREKEYVEAAKAGGCGDVRIIARHILPNALGPIIVNATLVVATAILIEATLSFLGLGVQPPRPALGALINDGRAAMQSSWWLVVMPGLTLVTICLCINFIGDGLRDALDPTQQED